MVKNRSHWVNIFVPTADFLKFSPHISDIQQVLLDQRMKCTATSQSRNLKDFQKYVKGQVNGVKNFCTYKLVSPQGIHVLCETSIPFGLKITANVKNFRKLVKN